MIAKYLLDRTDYQGVVYDAIAVVVEPVGDFSGVGVDCVVVVVAVAVMLGCLRIGTR